MVGRHAMLCPKLWLSLQCLAMPCLAWHCAAADTNDLAFQPTTEEDTTTLADWLAKIRSNCCCMSWRVARLSPPTHPGIFAVLCIVCVVDTRSDTATYCSFIQQRTAALYSVYTHRYSNVLQLYIAQIQQRTAALYSIYACVHTCVLRSPMFCSGKYPEVGKITTQEAPTTTPPDTTAHRVVAQLQALLQEEDMVTVASTAGASRYSAVFCCILSYTTLLYNHAWCSAQTLIYRQGSIDKCRPFHTVASIPLTWLLRCGCLQQRAGCWDFPVVSASWQYDR